VDRVAKIRELPRWPDQSAVSGQDGSKGVREPSVGYERLVKDAVEHVVTQLHLRRLNANSWPVSIRLAWEFLMFKLMLKVNLTGKQSRWVMNLLLLLLTVWLTR